MERAGLVGVAVVVADCAERGMAEEEEAAACCPAGEKDASALGIGWAAVAATMDPWCGRTEGEEAPVPWTGVRGGSID